VIANVQDRNKLPCGTPDMQAELKRLAITSRPVTSLTFQSGEISEAEAAAAEARRASGMLPR
jgi:hypothetical protein